MQTLELYCYLKARYGIVPDASADQVGKILEEVETLLPLDTLHSHYAIGCAYQRAAAATIANGWANSTLKGHLKKMGDHFTRAAECGKEWAETERSHALLSEFLAAYAFQDFDDQNLRKLKKENGLYKKQEEELSAEVKRHPNPSPYMALARVRLIRFLCDAETTHEDRILECYQNAFSNYLNARHIGQERENVYLFLEAMKGKVDDLMNKKEESKSARLKKVGDFLGELIGESDSKAG